jgi:3-hydroxybutyryl-CoA dehydrogenase
MTDKRNLVGLNQIGVLGSGTMGRGIALTALLVDLKVVLYDISEDMLKTASIYIENHLSKKQLSGNLNNLTITTHLDDLRGCGCVIEAAPEDLQLKQDLFAQLGKICPPPAILATNTSTLPVTAITASADNPERTGGMHFFNPAPVLPLVEVVRGAATSSETIEAMVGLARAMGKTPVITGDTPGFIVNRVARPFYGEALRLLGEGAANHTEIDRIIRLGAGFRMGPFELMDLIGIDINYAATRSMFESTFGEPRYRPHWIQAQMVQQQALGRKTGRGFYRYDEGGRPVEETKPSTQRQTEKSHQVERALLAGSNWAPGLADALKRAGIAVETESHTSGPPQFAIITAGSQEGLREQLSRIDLELPPDVPLICQCADITLAEAAASVKHPERLVGFDGLFCAGRILTLTATDRLSPGVRSAVEELAFFLNKEPLWVQDTPGLIAPRIICMLANEAAFAAGEGVADPDTIDKAMQLGANYPLGPLAWAKEIGYDRVVSVLEHLYAEYGEERYRIAPVLRRWKRQAQF